MNKKQRRLKRAKRSRMRIFQQRAQGVHSLSVFRSAQHIYAQLFDPTRSRVVASASTLETELRDQKFANKTAAAAEVGRRVGKKIAELGVKVAVDRSGYLYHGRVKALIEGAREAGAQF